MTHSHYHLSLISSVLWRLSTKPLAHIPMWQSYIGCQSNFEFNINYVCLCTMFTTNLHHNTCPTLFNQLLQPVAIVELVCVPLTLPTMSNNVLGLSLESGGLASRARPPGITYLMTCSTALTLMYSRNSSRHFFSNVHLSQTDFI